MIYNKEKGSSITTKEIKSGNDFIYPLEIILTVFKKDERKVVRR